MALFAKMANISLFLAGKACQVSESRLERCSMRKKSFLLVVFGLIVAAALAGPNEALTRLADGFDYPVGKPNADGYRVSRGFTPHGHLGEYWVEQGGGGIDFRDPVFAAGNGIITLCLAFRRA